MSEFLCGDKIPASRPEWDYICSLPMGHDGSHRDRGRRWALDPRIICLCGSTRFMEAFQQANLQETLRGNIVLSVGCNTKSDQGIGITDETKAMLDELHKRKIDLADEIFVLNVGGYIGASTKSEVDYAIAHNKPVRYLEAIGGV